VIISNNLRPYAQLGLDSGSIPSLFTYEDIVEELISEIPEVREVPDQVHKFWHDYVGDNNALPPAGSMLMVEEPWMSSEKLDDGTHLHEIVKKEHQKDNLEIPSCVEHSTRDDMEITFLGTGSSQPSKYWNVSSIYINLFARGGILLDCGEGTLGQLKRRFGVNGGVDEVVKSLRCIWISHIHADHHTGLARVLSLRSKLLKGTPHKPLFVIGPRPLERFLKAYSTLEELDMQFLDCRHTLKPTVEAFLNENATESTVPQLENTLFAPGSRMENYNQKPTNLRDTTALGDFKEVLQESGLEILYSVPVVHCPQAFGVVLKATEKESSAGKAIPGWKVVYSGDTRPYPTLIDASRDATVLIHEVNWAILSYSCGYA
jgi:ribonuclease Z